MHKICEKKVIAIVIALNDLDLFHGGSRNGLKSEISYFDQFLMLYDSIQKNWKKEYFDYYFVLIHSKPFKEEKQQILDKLNLNVLKVDYPFHEVKIRPMCYSIPLECDFRLVLDVDMLAFKEPNFDFSFDAQAMYGGNKYNKKQWNEICETLSCNYPKFSIKKWKPGKYNEWIFHEHYVYQSGKKKKKMFPYFNNGAILINNNLSSHFSEVWDEMRKKYTFYVKEKFNLDIDLEGQDVVGLAINQVTSNWNIFMQGMNFILNDSFPLGIKLNKDYKGDLYLLHYINIKIDNPYFDVLNKQYQLIKIKYY